ncbi:LuxR C-terminal-related transcriptional regulator [Nocardioides sp. YR527]|uniref:LuxR C-terminal-related transcriptional regulator n=1 Tax=Nocardioides sp. YR527 TaxID=1881028 RepID=UPI000B80B64C|nr:LuxR C-terminal-related transcriptional regulator [Nocardioides sp. YR527]
MLVADWATRAATRGEPVAWLSLHKQDDSPYEFWSALIEALVLAGLPGRTEQLDGLTPPAQGTEPRFVTKVVESLLVAGVRWIVLDDVHLLHDDEVLRGLDILLAELPPEVGLVMACRSEPSIALHRLRLDGSLSDVRGKDLAFTDGEALELFAASDLSMTADAISDLVGLTEGWAAPLRMAVVVATIGGGNPAEVVASFDGDVRAVIEYVLTEVVHRLDPELVEFLYATCAPHHLSIDLAAHLSGRPDAGALLDRLCAANALVSQSGDSAWYRYHALLRSCLLAALARRDVDAPARQHRATAVWLAAHGEPATALRHALRSGDRDLLNHQLRAHGLHMVLSGRGDVVREAVASHDSLVADQRVAIIAALAALDVSDFAAADAWLSAALSRDLPSEPTYAAMLAAAVVQRSLAGGDVVAALQDSAILDIAMTGDGDVNLILLAHRGPARMRTGDYPGAIDDLEQALALARSRRFDQMVLETMSQLAGMTGSMCDFNVSLDWANQAIAFATQHGWRDSPRLAYSYLLAAWTAFQTGDPLAQKGFAELGLRALEGVNNVEVEVGVRSMHALATFEATTGRDRTEAAETFRRIWQLDSTDHVSPALISFSTPQEVRLALAVGHVDWAAEAAARVRDQMPGSAEYTFLNAQILAATGGTRDALAELGPVLDRVVPAHVPTTVVHAHVLAAALESSLGSHVRAFDALRKALLWAVPNNFRRPFIDLWPHLEPLLSSNRSRFGPAEDFVTALLTDHADPEDGSIGVIGTLLSARELDVLHDLPSRLTIPEIAQAEGVSENTVKTHIRSIYQKLGVNTRSAAVRSARERGLI